MHGHAIPFLRTRVCDTSCFLFTKISMSPLIFFSLYKLIIGYCIQKQTNFVDLTTSIEHFMKSEKCFMEIVTLTETIFAKLKQVQFIFRTLDHITKMLICEIA
jgi:hypothetical protein